MNYTKTHHQNPKLSSGEKMDAIKDYIEIREKKGREEGRKRGRKKGTKKGKKKGNGKRNEKNSTQFILLRNEH